MALQSHYNLLGTQLVTQTLSIANILYHIFDNLSRVTRVLIRPTEKGTILMDSVNSKNRSVAYYIFRTSMTVNGVVLYAKDYGLKAFRIPIYK